MTRIEMIESWLNAVWGEGRVDLAADLFTQDAQAAGILPEIGIQPGDFEDFVPAFRALVDRIEVTCLRHFETEDWLWVLPQMTGVARATGLPVSAVGQIALRFEGDKVAEAYNAFDALTIFEQIGLLPQDTLALCLSGEKIG